MVPDPATPARLSGGTCAFRGTGLPITGSQRQVPDPAAKSQPMPSYVACRASSAGVAGLPS